jgi:hypothetical protein
MTTITVYAIAWGGKFIGQGQQGKAVLTVTDSSGNIIVNQQPITQGNPQGDGSGNTPAIMNPQMIVWGTPISTANAYNYTFSYSPAAPIQLTFTVQVFHYGNLVATASNQAMVWPGLTLGGPMSVVVTIPGLLSSIPVPQGGLKFTNGRAGTLTANVYMMCGCMIDNHYWPASNFYPQIFITDRNGNILSASVLSWTAPATFSASWTPTTAGQFYAQAFVVETSNGNTACSAKVPLTVLSA